MIKNVSIMRTFDIAFEYVMEGGKLNVEGPDFVSSAEESVNALGLNTGNQNDKNYILRRALLLRSLCERKLDMKKGIAPVSPNILWAMLLVPEYKHGALSVEAVFNMSCLEDVVWENVSPAFYSKLMPHVDADAFIKLVLRDVILNNYVEPLAQMIHEDYVEKMKNEGEINHPSVVPWNELPEEFKESNRAQARSFEEKLNTIGYNYDAGDTPFPSVEEFDDATVLLLAQNEHIRWMNERLANGWIYGETRDDERKIQPLLVEWSKLPESEKKKDIEVVKNIIPHLKKIGLRVFKTI